MTSSEVARVSAARPDLFERKLIVLATVSTFIGLVVWPVLFVSATASLIAAVMIGGSSRGTRVLVYVLASANVLIVAAAWTYHALTT